VPNIELMVFVAGELLVAPSGLAFRDEDQRQLPPFSCDRGEEGKIGFGVAIDILMDRFRASLCDRLFNGHDQIPI
jgi:hypothetical protein